MKNFWLDLPKPFTVLAPMDGVTDVVFRQIVTEIGKPDVLFTEFVNVEGLSSKGKDKVSEGLMFDQSQKPVVAQIWGTTPDDFKKAAQLCRELGFAGVDINMGCPVRDIIKNGACSALIKNPKLAKEIIEATKDGAGDLPVSVKTRIGFSKMEIDTWIKFLLEQNLNALTVHLRTSAEMSKVPAHWELMPEVIELRDLISPETIIIGNGDIKTMDEINEKFNEFKCEGFMVGRGIFQNPWIFNKSIEIEKIKIEERIDLFIKHINLFNKTWSNEKNPALLKKFCKTYLNNFTDAGALREKIMECSTTLEMKDILNSYLSESNN